MSQAQMAETTSTISPAVQLGLPAVAGVDLLGVGQHPVPLVGDPLEGDSDPRQDHVCRLGLARRGILSHCLMPLGDAR